MVKHTHIDRFHISIGIFKVGWHCSLAILDVERKESTHTHTQKWLSHEDCNTNLSHNHRAAHTYTQRGERRPKKEKREMKVLLER